MQLIIVCKNLCTLLYHRRVIIVVEKRALQFPRLVALAAVRCVDGLFVFPELFHVFCETKSQCAAVRRFAVFSLDCTHRSRRNSQDVAGRRKHGQHLVEGSSLSM